MRVDCRLIADRLPIQIALNYFEFFGFILRSAFPRNLSFRLPCGRRRCFFARCFSRLVFALFRGALS
jgi:hypothetical protein